MRDAWVETLRALFQEDMELPVKHTDRRVWIRPLHLNTSLTPGALKWAHCKSLDILHPNMHLLLLITQQTLSLCVCVCVYARNVVKGKGLLNSHDLDIESPFSLDTTPSLSLSLCLSLSLWWLCSPEALWKMWCIFPGFITCGSLLAASQFRNAQLTRQRVFHHTGFYYLHVFLSTSHLHTFFFV